MPAKKGNSTVIDRPKRKKVKHRGHKAPRASKPDLPERAGLPAVPILPLEIWTTIFENVSSGYNEASTRYPSVLIWNLATNSGLGLMLPN